MSLLKRQGEEGGMGGADAPGIGTRQSGCASAEQALRGERAATFSFDVASYALLDWTNGQAP
ncbi:hypothetical protein [Streptomyces sp. NBC_01615]|uniref:hypothetical protein n=1 Tax=Streptomyces sp. NBC_01615 TaxID=2975898 RepID=UPI00386C8A74